tara:strand:- start:124 stop:846 length:723 start_codon:yes stop_codon:yes gene_type:complete
MDAVQNTTVCNKLKDARLYITQYSQLEELLNEITNTTTRGMFGSAEEKKDCMRDALKFLNFTRTMKPLSTFEEEEVLPDKAKTLKEETMIFCVEYKNYLKNLCVESCSFIIENHNILKELIENTKNNLDALKNVKERYKYRNSELVETEYNTRVLSLMEEFENSLKSVRSKKFTHTMDRNELTTMCKKIQSDFLSLDKTINSNILFSIKDSYESDFYDIEKEVCVMFEEYLKKWSNSLLL